MTKNILILRVITAFTLAVVGMPVYIAAFLKLAMMIKK